MQVRFDIKFKIDMPDVDDDTRTALAEKVLEDINDEIVYSWVDHGCDLPYEYTIRLNNGIPLGTMKMEASSG